jgi:serine/threonine-protein kinase
MYATVNTTPPPPSQHNRAVPAMLDLIVAKAMAKLLEDRYQTVKELADDLREVRRQVDSGRPAAALKARSSPVAPPVSTPPSAIIERHVDTATMPMNVGGGKKDEDEKPIALNKTFDSFDATLRLAAMTDQTEDFREYISETQKMRAYRGKIEATSPLAANKELKKQVEANQQQAGRRAGAGQAASRARPQPMQLPERVPVGSGSGASNLIAVAAIVVLSVAAVALVIALVLK